MSELFEAVDALVASRAPLPPTQERKRLRQAHGLTLDDAAAALKVVVSLNALALHEAGRHPHHQITNRGPADSAPPPHHQATADPLKDSRTAHSNRRSRSLGDHDPIVCIV